MWNLAIMEKNNINTCLPWPETVCIPLQAAACKVFFLHFVRLTMKGGLKRGHLRFLISLPYEKVQMTLTHSLATFVVQIFFSHSNLASTTCTSVIEGIIMNRRQFVVMEASLPGLPIKRETYYYANVSQRLM